MLWDIRAGKFSKVILLHSLRVKCYIGEYDDVFDGTIRDVLIFGREVI